MNIPGTTISLLLAGTLMLTACTITPAAPPTAAATAPVATTAAALGASQAATATTSTSVTNTAAVGAATPVTGTQVTSAPMTTTTTVVTTTITTATAGAGVSGTQLTTDTAAALPTATPAVGITVTTPVSTPVAASAQAAAVVSATTVVTDANAGTILQVVNSTPGLETLSSALTASGMATALEQPGPLTFFAPTNDAFAALPQDQLDALLADPATLTPILQYHIVIDNVAASRLGALGAALSSSGQPITVTVQSDGSLLINDAHVVQADIPASNGVIHLIDKVLIPPSTTP